MQYDRTPPFGGVNMCSAFERKIAFRYLRSRRQEGLISVIAMFSLSGIALGVATLIVVLSVMNGVREELIKSIIGLEGHISVYASENGIRDYADIAKSIETVSGVQHALPKVEGQIMLSFRGHATGAVVAAFRAEDIERKSLLASTIAPDALTALKNAQGVVIGSRMAEKLGIQVGEMITLISPEGRATVAGIVPRVKAYQVVGLFTIGMFAYDNSLILMPFEEAQTYFKLRSADDMEHAYPGRASLLEVSLQDANAAPEVARHLSDTLPGYRIYNWKSSNQHIFQAVLVQRNVAFFIVMLIVLVAAFNIISSLIMLVHEKEKQIAILRTMGASSASIMRIFLLCGATIGSIGSLVGVGLGLLVAYNTESIQHGLETLMGHRLFADELYFLSHLPSRVEMGEVLAVLSVSLFLAFIATLYPAKKAAALNPAEALK